MFKKRMEQDLNLVPFKIDRNFKWNGKLNLKSLTEKIEDFILENIYDKSYEEIINHIHKLKDPIHSIHVALVRAKIEHNEYKIQNLKKVMNFMLGNIKKYTRNDLSDNYVFNKNENNSINYYKHLGFYEINNHLMNKLLNDKLSNTFIEKHIKVFDNLFKKFPLQNDIITYRVTNNLPKSFHKIGHDSFESITYISSSLSEEIARGFINKNSDNYLIKFNLKKGTKAIFIDFPERTNTPFNPHEREILINRGTKFSFSLENKIKLHNHLLYEIHASVL